MKKTIEDYILLQESMSFVKTIYHNISHCHDLQLRSQIQQAAVAVPSNIAKGVGMGWEQDFIHFLGKANYACTELCTLLRLISDLHFVSLEITHPLIEKVKQISSMINDLRKEIEKS